MTRFRVLVVAALVAAIGLIAPMPAYASRMTCPDGQTCHPPLVFHGGAVMHHPRVYLIFWGSRWQTEQYGVESALIKEFSGLSGTAINNILSQYGDGTDYIHNDVTLAGWYDMYDPAHDPGFVLGPLEAPGQINYAISHSTGWTNSPDTQFIIFPQYGTYATPTPASKSCGYHTFQSGFIFAYVDFPFREADNERPLCTTDSPTPEMTAAAFHEYAEAATHPHAGDNDGWHTDGDSPSQEIADLCYLNQETYSPQPLTSFGWTGSLGELEELWDNSRGDCYLARGEDGLTPPSQPKHTIFGWFQTIYDALWTAKYPAMPDIGYPTEEQASYSGGLRQRFSNGAMYAKSGVAHEVHGDIYRLYAAKYEPHLTATLGFPASDEIDAPGGGRQNTFNGSSCNGSGSVILWTQTTKAHEMQGCIYDAYLKRFNGSSGAYGYPTSDEQGTKGGTGRVNYMHGTTCGSASGSGFFWSANTGVWPVHGCIFQKYEQIGEDQSGLGLPTSDEYSTADGIRQDYSNGHILWANGAGTVYISGGSNCVDYGPYMTGPSACTGFYTTGTWFSGGGVGLLGKEMWTYANGAVKDSSAVYHLTGMDSTHAWQVQAYIPNNHSNAAHAHYVITSPGGGTGNGTVNQQSYTNAWASVGYLCTTDGTATVTLWDDGGDPSSLQVGADAIRVVRSSVAC